MVGCSIGTMAVDADPLGTLKVLGGWQFQKEKVALRVLRLVRMATQLNPWGFCL